MGVPTFLPNLNSLAKRRCIRFHSILTTYYWHASSSNLICLLCIVHARVATKFPSLSRKPSVSESRRLAGSVGTTLGRELIPSVCSPTSGPKSYFLNCNPPIPKSCTFTIMISRYERGILSQNFMPGNVFVLRYVGNYGTGNRPEKFRRFRETHAGFGFGTKERIAVCLFCFC